MSFAGYPPPDHFLGDLGMEAEVTTETTARVRTRADVAVVSSASIPRSRSRCSGGGYPA